MVLTKGAVNELRSHLGFTQIRFHCSRHPGHIFHVATAANSTGEAVVQYFSGQTDIQPNACGSFVRMDNDNSIMSRQCHQWGWEKGTYKVGKWGHSQDQDRLYIYPAFVYHAQHWHTSPDGTRHCDDGGSGKTAGDFWKIYVRWKALAKAKKLIESWIHYTISKWLNRLRKHSGLLLAFQLL